MSMQSEVLPIEDSTPGRMALKRAIDVLASAIALSILLPLFAIIAIAIWLDDRGPPFYRQIRIGRAGRPFRIIKFRSMRPPSKTAGSNLTVAGDPRVTQVGAFLRYAKLDELPQLFNVLAGDMSLVGPRPETPDLIVHYTPSQRVVMLSVRPGMTDYASLLFRDESAILARSADPARFYREHVMPLKYELYATYVRKIGPKTDLCIILATLWRVIFPSAHTVLIDKAISNRLQALARQGLAMPPSGRAPSVTLPSRRFGDWTGAWLRPLQPKRLATLFGPFARKVMSLSALSAAGQATFVIALPVLSRLYTPADFGLFTIYLSIVNIGGPIVGLKFESALYAGRTRDEAAATLALSLLTALVTSSAAAIALFFLGGQLAAHFGPEGRMIVRILPLGLLLAGMWSVSSAWAIKSEAVSTLGIARFAQPTMMTALQLAVGFIYPSGGVALIGAHLVSHLGYTIFIFCKTLTRRDLRTLRPAMWRQLGHHAKAQRHFPLFLLPAQVSYLAVSNLPPLLLSLFYGAGIAGHCGVAYRLVAAPLAIASLPLGAIFTGVASRTPDLALIIPLARKVFLANLLLVSVPILLFGAAAPSIAPAVLGDRWAITGQVISAFALLGAAQTLAAPFTEITSIFRIQRLRFAIEFATATLVVTAIGVGGTNHWSPLLTIWVMASAGAASSFLGLMLIWLRLRAMTGRSVVHGAMTTGEA